MLGPVAARDAKPAASKSSIRSLKVRWIELGSGQGRAETLFEQQTFGSKGYEGLGAIQPTLQKRVLLSELGKTASMKYALWNSRKLTCSLRHALPWRAAEEGCTPREPS